MIPVFIPTLFNYCRKWSPILSIDVFQVRSTMISITKL